MPIPQPNPYQTKIGRAGREGPAFPLTALGDEIRVIATPAKFTADSTPYVTVVANGNAARMAVAEARKLAAAILAHCAQIEEIDNV